MRRTFLAALAAALLAAGPALAGDLPPADVPGALNPDVTDATIAQTICVPGWTATVRPPASYTDKLKREQMERYGIAGEAREFEEDHRVPLSAGGNPTSPQNLWPEIWTGPRGAHAKDRLESAVHRDICAGRLTLERGRAIFLGDWWPEWEARFGTEETAARR